MGLYYLIKRQVNDELSNQDSNTDITMYTVLIHKNYVLSDMLISYWSLILPHVHFLKIGSAENYQTFFFKALPVGASLVAQLVKNLPAMRETWIWTLGWEDPLEKEKATHSRIHGEFHGVTKSLTQLSDFHFLSASRLSINQWCF